MTSRRFLLPPLHAMKPAPLWAIQIALSAALVALLLALHLSAALLIGPMAAAIAVATGGGRIAVPRLPFVLAQGVLGCAIGRVITGDLLGDWLRRWPLFAAAVGSVIAVSLLIGWLLARWRVLPGSTALWGSFPGAATAMALMAGAFGADVRLVAFMQYLRVLFVALAASILARAMHAHGVPPPPPEPASWQAAALAFAFAAGCALAGQWLRLPAGALLLPLFAGALAHGLGWLDTTLPHWLLAASYALIGWSIGQRFTREILAYALHALPRIALSIAALIALCGLLALALARVAGVDMLTAYLAMSPGGADSIAIIAASSKVDMPFVMALQLTRTLSVMLLGPPLARLLARTIAPRAGANVDAGGASP